MDAGFSTAREFIYTHFAEQLSTISPESTYKDAKSKLQEALQKSGCTLPEYQIVASEGEQHEQTFTVQCTLPNTKIVTQAIAQSRRKAEQMAATQALDLFLQQKAR